MSENGKKGDEHLFIHLVSNYTQGAWVALGKLKNPVTDKVEKNLEEAGFYIDMLEMVKNRMAGNLSPDEEKFIVSNLGSLQLNYIEEKKGAKEAEVKEKAKDKAEAEKDADGEGVDEQGSRDSEETKEETE